VCVICAQEIDPASDWGIEALAYCPTCWKEGDPRPPARRELAAALERIAELCELKEWTRPGEVVTAVERRIKPTTIGGSNV
jgi:hypothetical protein